MAAVMAGHMIDGIFELEMAAILVLFWLLVGIMAGLREDGSLPAEGNLTPDPASPTDARSTGMTVSYWAVALFACVVALVLVPEGVVPDPAILAALSIVSAIVGVGAVAAAVVSVDAPALARQESQRNRLNRKEMAARVRSFGPALAPILGASLLVALLLATQGQFITATIADRDGTASVAMAQPQQGLAYLQQASQAAGFEPVYDVELGEVYSSLAASAPASSAGIADLRPVVGDARTVDPRLAVSLNRGQLFGLAVDAMRSAAALWPLEPEFYADLGNTYSSWGLQRQAIDQYQQAERLSANNPKYFADEALAWIKAGQAAEAVQRGLVATRLDPSYWYAHYALALAYHARGERPQARVQASLGLFWSPVAIPKPPPSQTKQLQNLARTG
jgi:tetratricopeptide (TPR) repeat protein